MTMEFGKRDMRKSAGVQSVPLRPPGGESSEGSPRENSPDKPTKSITSGVILPVIAGGIFFALAALWIAQHVAG
jgi:hypothetical protein